MSTGIEERVRLKSFLVRSGCGIRRLLWLVAGAFGWRNLGGEDEYEQMREAVPNHPWRLPKEGAGLFDWIAQLIHLLLPPRPEFHFATG